MFEMFKVLKFERRCLIFKQNIFVTALSLMGHMRRGTGTFKMPCFQNEGHYRSENLSTDKFLGVLSHGGDKNLAGLANFDFRLL